MPENQRLRELELGSEQMLKMYEVMLLARKIDERMWLLNRAGKTSFVVSCQGQEATQVGAAFALDRTADYTAPYYRDLGVVLACGMTPKELMLQAFGRAEDPNSGGRQMPGHFGQKKNRILTGSSPVTTQLPHAAGVALAAKMDGKEIASFVTLGEGSSSQGDFHEGLNFAGVHKLPLIVMVENNKYAISVPMNKQIAGGDISKRAEGYGIAGVKVDGNDPLSVYGAVKKARERAVNGEGPTLIESVTSRLTAHSSDDNELIYRDATEIKQAKENDNIVLFTNYLKEIDVLNEDIENELHNKIEVIIDEATDYAENAASASPADILKHVYEV